MRSFREHEQIIRPGAPGYIPYDIENYNPSESEGEIEDDDYTVSDEGHSIPIGNVHLSQPQVTHEQQQPIETFFVQPGQQQHTITQHTIQQSTQQPLGGIIKQKPYLEPLEETEFGTFTTGSGQVSPKTTQGLSFQEPNVGEQGLHMQQAGVLSSDIKNKTYPSVSDNKNQI
jgi:hypothetical protein